MTPEAEKQLTDALRVLVLTPHIRTYLRHNDPKALAQAEAALADAAQAELEEMLTPAGLARRLFLWKPTI